MRQNRDLAYPAKKFSFIKIINGPQLSCDGWKGSYHVKDIFLEEKPQMREHMIVVVDEADKLFEPIGLAPAEPGLFQKHSE